jgi:predicted alpha/beta hydrolase
MAAVNPHVLVSPAMAVPSRFYRPLVAAFEDVGWTARALGRRGFEPDGPVASRRADWSYADEIDDLAAAVRAARAEQPDRPVLLLGHSLGAQLAVGLQQRPDRAVHADGLVVVGASTPHHRYYPYGGLPMLAFASAIPTVTLTRGYLPRPAFGAPGARTLMREWAHFVRTGRPPFDVVGPVRTPSLVVHLQGDAYAVSAANKRFVEQFLDPAAVTRWVYTRDDVPEGGTTDHVRWVKHPSAVVQHVLGWWQRSATSHPAWGRGRKGDAR